MERIHFDRIDDAILRALQNNARISNKELAAEVGLAPSSCLERVRRLTDRGVVKGYQAKVDPVALGVGLQRLSPFNSPTSRNLVETFRAHLLTLDEVVSVYHMGGENDFLVHVAVRDATISGLGTRCIHDPCRGGSHGDSPRLRARGAGRLA